MLPFKIGGKRPVFWGVAALQPLIVLVSNAVCDGSLKVLKCEILISWIVMIFISWSSIGRGFEGWNKNWKFFTDGLDTGHFVFATACAVNASKLLLPGCLYTFTKNKIFPDLLQYAHCTLAISYRRRIVRKQIVTICAVYTTKANHMLIWPI
jgi:hypothetical protein